MAAGDGGARVRVDGRVLSLTNLDKVLFPATGTTKAELIDYYRRIAPVMIPHLAGRAVTRKRWPNGVETEPFFTKNLDSGTPDWVPRRGIVHHERTSTYPLVEDTATLVWLAQMASIELHVPQWRFPPGDSPFVLDGSATRPDRFVLDLDPGPGVGLAQCAEVALAAKGYLDDVGLAAIPVTSGSKGLHLYATIHGVSSEQASAFAKELAGHLAEDLPQLVVTQMKRSLRDGKVFVDYSQNNAAKTTVSPYSVRGRDQPWVAAPRTWGELGEPGLAHLELGEVLERAADGDLLAPLLPPDPLSTYRAKRDSARTPEPVPFAAPVAAPAGDPRFVIQEHHARRLHWDLRLEHDGVLASWAVPRGVPTTTGHNRLAVHTEDHPMEYLTFHGSIPKGEYGGGEMTVWDTGTYTPEKFRDDEVIFVLHGQRVQGRFALIRTDPGRGGGKEQWLLHLMKDQSGVATSPEKRAHAVVDAPDAAADDGAHISLSDAVEPRRIAPDLRPMLATAGQVGDGDYPAREWAFEPKWDGYRALVRFSARGVALQSRSGRDFTQEFAELAVVPEELAAHAGVLDAEIVALDAAGRPSFHALQERGTGARPAMRLLVFDVLHLDGTSLVNKRYSDRRQVLLALPLPAADPDHLGREERDVGGWRRSVTIGTSVRAALRASAEARLEGVIAKRLDARYLPGRRGHAWVKLKHSLDAEVVIGGWRPGQGRRAGGIGSLLLGVPDDDGGLRYVGKVGTGFTDAALDALLATLEPRERTTSPFTTEVPRVEAKVAHWVRPDVVGEVTFDSWTDDGVLRAARWRGLRPDKAPADLA
ncbi:DNA polymerase LigD, polymerase domain protein [Beutenbergia cavernae DSM 12333]|uniref:DNA ligase (ATP) n=1 Tax=Beutenbergia cavernae (strain ATCC BAA-8 / DSM 12333 / CCUG 43141 / JCM 11478 / NBRC 16432 / NCIMB 13614 / HKI 0122) TaxID=471853 RepID=C5BY21_BEUC1|nr:ATP-dependent DNA ligase [Beutenbergia cavernae]ACQ78915.1 DNA polymerase LigD, polymerase domain protein [Beutenbergia cavernae DSM 12333]